MKVTIQEIMHVKSIVIVKSSPQIFIQTGEKEYNVGEWYQSYLLKRKGHGITQGRQVCANVRV